MKNIIIFLLLISIISLSNGKITLKKTINAMKQAENRQDVAKKRIEKEAEKESLEPKKTVEIPEPDG